MGLAPKSVEIAKEILTEIVHMVQNNRLSSNHDYEGPESSGSLPVVEYDKHDARTHVMTHSIMVCGRKSTPGAWENVFINVDAEWLDTQVLDYFYERKKEVPNSHFINFKEFQKEGIVSLGWF
jgi:hypothetical protein